LRTSSPFESHLQMIAVVTLQDSYQRLPKKNEEVKLHCSSTCIKSLKWMPLLKLTKQHGNDGSACTLSLTLKSAYCTWHWDKLGTKKTKDILDDADLLLCWNYHALV